MPAELGQTTDPKALIPGDPPAIYENARVLTGRANSALAAGDALKRIDTGAWRGPASDRFHEEHQTEVPRWLLAADSLDSAAQVLNGYANTLAWAQGQAAEAIAQWQQGEAETQRATTAYNKAVADAQAQTRSNAERGDPTVVQPPAFNDTGEPLRQAAREILNRARVQLTGEGDKCAEALRAEAVLAPQDSRKQADANFYGGIWDTISGAGEAVLGAITDPAGTVAAMAHNITHPVETFKELVAWDDWANGRGDRALGKITGGILLLGAGKVAKTVLNRADHGAHTPEVDRTPDSQRVENEAVEYATRPAKMDHVFVPKHKLEPLVETFGGREGAMVEIVKSVKNGTDLPESGPFEVVREIAGQPVHIRGAVVNGVPKMGTVFTP